MARFSQNFEKPSEKVPENICFCAHWATHSQFMTCGIGDLILGKLPPRCQCKLAYHRPADIGNANNQAGLPLGITRVLLVECMDLQVQLCCKLHIEVLGGPILPSMIGA